MWNVRLNEAQAGIKTAGRNISNLTYADDTTLTAESKEELKSLLMKVKEENGKAVLKLNTQKTTWHLVPSLHVKWMGKQWKQWQALFSWAPKSLQMVTAALKLRLLLLGRKAMTNLDSILKNRDITLPTTVHLVKAIIFPVVMYGYESWTIKKPECLRIDAFELWCWRLLRVPWTARRSNQSIPKEISPEYSLEGLMLKLKLQYFSRLACCNPWGCKELGHGPQHARVLCPSPTPKACSNSCPSSQWCHPIISSSVVPFSSCLQSFPAAGSFPRSQFFASGGQSIGASASASVLLIGRWVLYHFLIIILIVLYVSKNIFLFFLIPVQANIKCVDRS